MTLPAFKAYDIRGRVPDELNEDLARRIGVALADQLSPGPVVVGHDVRLTSPALQDALAAGLRGAGREVIDIGLCGTEEVYFQTDHRSAAGGVMVTASHNPKQWNALKLLNSKGEFISGEEGARVLEIAEADAFSFAEVDDLGSVTNDATYLQKHIDAVLALPLVDKKAIEAANFSVVVDAVNSTGGIFVPALLEALGVKKITRLYCEPTGHFPHNPEPLPEQLTDLAEKIKEVKFNI